MAPGPSAGMRHGPMQTKNHAKIMKTPPKILPLVLLGLAGLPARADTTFTSTGWLSAVPLPGITCTNSSGQVSLRGNVHVVRLLGDDPRATGRLQAWMDLAYQPDGSALFSGPAYIELGTWDAGGTTFTPSGGIWAVNYSGVALPDGSSQYTMAGHGLCGNIEAMRFNSSATRSNSAPTTPYFASGTIKPAPFNTRTVVDNFDNNFFETSIWPTRGAGVGSLVVAETNQSLTLVGTWRVATYSIMSHSAWVWADPGWSASAGRTVELRANLVGLNLAAAGAILGLYHSAGGEGFGISKGADWILLWKETGTSWTCLSGVRVPTSNANVILVVSVTPVGPNVVLTGQVLDHDGTVLAQQTYVDTPASDPALSKAEMAQLIGSPVLSDVGPDVAGTPWNSGTSVLLGVFHNTDGTLPPAEATFDNVELRTYEVPQVGIQRAVRLSWPGTGMNFAVEGAPAADGPWLPVLDANPPGMQLFTVPATDPMKFFRLQQAP